MPCAAAAEAHAMNANQHTARDTASPPCCTARHQADQTARCQHTHRKATTTPPLLPNNEGRPHTPAQHTGRTRADATRCNTHTRPDPSVRGETPDRKHSSRTDHHCTAQTKNKKHTASSTTEQQRAEPADRWARSPRSSGHQGRTPQAPPPSAPRPPQAQRGQRCTYAPP